jgi:hypothetical protein
VLGVDPDSLAADLAGSYARELESMRTALSKVRGVP